MKTGAALLALCLLSRIAIADTEPATITIAPVCVELDLERDALRDEERAMAKRMLERVLERENLLVLETGCAERYRIAHERSNERIVILMKSDNGGRKLSAATLDELPERYTKMVRSLLEAKTTAAAVAAEQPSIAEPEIDAYDRNSFATDEGPEPVQEVTADRLLYMRLGLRPSEHGGTGGAVGYRHEYAKVSLDFSVTWLTSGGDSLNTSGAGLALKALHVTAPDKTRSFYAGGGLSLGYTEQYVAGGGVMTGGGPQAELTAGYEFARDSTGFRVFLEADATLPFYELEGYNGMTEWSPSFVLSIGAGR